MNKIDVESSGIRGNLDVVKCHARDRINSRFVGRPGRRVGEPPTCAACRGASEVKSSEAILPRVFRQRVRVATSQLGRFEPCDGCRIELATRRAVSVRQRAERHFRHAAAGARLADTPDRLRDSGGSATRWRHLVAEPPYFWLVRLEELRHLRDACPGAAVVDVKGRAGAADGADGVVADLNRNAPAEREDVV